MDSLPPASIPSGSVLQRSNAARSMGQGGGDTVAIDMDHLDNRPHMSNDMSQMQIVEQQVRISHNVNEMSVMEKETRSIGLCSHSLQVYM